MLTTNAWGPSELRRGSGKFWPLEPWGRERRELSSSGEEGRAQRKGDSTGSTKGYFLLTERLGDDRRKEEREREKEKNWGPFPRRGRPGLGPAKPRTAGGRGSSLRVGGGPPGRRGPGGPGRGCQGDGTHLRFHTATPAFPEHNTQCLPLSFSLGLNTHSHFRNKIMYFFHLLSKGQIPQETAGGLAWTSLP